MSIGPDDVKKIAVLARLQVDEASSAALANKLDTILKLVDQLQAVDTTNVEPMAHPMDAVQVLRADVVTETDLRAKFQAIAPATENGLYLVPKVIE